MFKKKDANHSFLETNVENFSEERNKTTLSQVQLDLCAVRVALGVLKGGEVTLTDALSGQWAVGSHLIPHSAGDGQCNQLVAVRL